MERPRIRVDMRVGRYTAALAPVPAYIGVETLREAVTCSDINAMAVIIPVLDYRTFEMETAVKQAERKGAVIFPEIPVTGGYVND